MIEINFVDGTGPVSSFIEFWTWGDWSHVDIKTTRGWLGARSNGGVQIRPWNYCSFTKQETRTITLPEEQEANIMNWFTSQIGKPYDYLAVAGMPFRKDWRDDKRWFCSELIMEGFQQAGVYLLNAQHMNRVTPRDLYLSPLLMNAQPLI
jgi:uncharacterized protein YycO